MLRSHVLRPQRLLSHCKIKSITSVTISVGVASFALNSLKSRTSLCEARTREIRFDALEVKKAKTDSALLASLLTSYDWVLFGLAAICSVLASLMTTVQARFIGRLFDSLGKSGTMEGGLARLLSVFVFQSFLSFASSTSLSIATTNFGVRLRTAFFSSIIRQDMSILDEKKTGELTHQLSQDVAALQTSVRESFTRGVESITSLVSGSLLLFSVSPSMALGLLGLLPLGAFAGTLLGEGLRALSQKSREASNRATGLASETISNVRTVRAFAAEDRETERYAKELQSGSTLKTKMAMLSGAFYSSISLGINLTTLLILGWGHHLIESGKLTKGDIATIATQVQLLERALARLSVLSASLSKSMKSSEHIFETLRRQPKIAPGVHVLNLDKQSLKGDIEFHNVSFFYPSRKEALVIDSLSFLAKQGETIALVGSSGSGKSTIFNLVERFYDPVSGFITLDNVDIRQLDPHWLRETIGYVPQKPDLFSGTIADNIRYGKLNASKEEIIEAAKRANAHDFIMGFPDGYDTQLGEQGIGMSGGQKQRICIARTLLLDPKVLLLGELTCEMTNFSLTPVKIDEITSGLDSESEFLVSKALEELMKGRTTLVIAHRLNTVKNASKIFVLEDGEIIELGTHDELIQKPNGAYKAFWERQNRGLKRANSQRST